MNNITEHIRNRRSVRTFDGRELTQNDMEKLASFAQTIENPFKIPVDFKLMNAKEYGLNCPVTVGTDLFVGGKIKYTENASVAFGYSFEMFVLYAQSIGIGTTWLGGTMNRSAFEQAMELDSDEIMPCASPLGYPSKKMSLRESLMRKRVKADERLPFEELFFDGSLDTPLTKEKAGKWTEALEMVRLAPSAVNKQPWRVVVCDNAVHFYLKRSKGFSYNEKLDMQKIDMAIALCAILAFNYSSKDQVSPQSTPQPQKNTQPAPTAEPTATPTAAPTEIPINRRGTAERIPESIRSTMAGYSMPANSTVSYDELSYLTIPHYDFDYNVVEGHLVVSKVLAEEVLDIFAELFDIKYPIERMELIDKYDADDYISIDYNNTSAFNYRLSTDGSSRLSRHALGRAIDINPQINPYVKSNGTGAHPNAKEYWSRDISKWSSEIAKAAYIGRDTEIYNIFVNKYGWEWGGAWSSYRDYQHFQK